MYDSRFLPSARTRLRAARLSASVFLLLGLPLLFAGCSLFPSWQRPSIAWRNYDYRDGLVSGAAPAGLRARGFEPVSMEGGIVCNSLVVAGEGAAKRYIAVALGPVATKNESDPVWTIAAAPPEASPSTLLVTYGVRLDDDGRVYAYSWADIVRSSDRGITWESLWRITNDTHPQGFADLEFRGNEVWAACRGDGSLLTFTSDRSTSRVLLPSLEGELQSVWPCSDGRVFAGTETGLYVSADGGSSFALFHAGGPVRDVFEPVAGGPLWAIVAESIVELSPAGAVLWDSLAQGFGPVSAVARSGSLLWALSVHPDGNSLLSVDTADPGATSATALGFTGSGTVAVDSTNGIYVTYPGGLAVSRDLAATWEHQDMGFSSVTMIQTTPGAVWAGLLGGGVARMTDSSTGWEILGIRDRIAAFYPRSTQEFLLSNPLMRSVDGGQIVTGVPLDASLRSSVSSIVGDSAGNVYCALEYSYQISTSSILLVQSDDFGDTWSEPETIYSGTEFPRHPLALVDEARGMLWVTTEAGIFRRGLSGSPWTREGDGGYDLCLDGAGNLYLIGPEPDFRLYRQGAGESSWTSTATPGLWKDDDLFVDGDGCVWIATVSGLLYSENGGASWAQYTTADGLASNYTTSVSVTGTGPGKTIWVGTALGASRGTIQ